MKKHLAKLVRGYDALWMSEASGLQLGFFRIGFALYMLVYLGVLAPHVTVLFSSHGVYAPYLVPDLAPPPALAWLLFSAMLGLSCSLLVGYRSELSAALLLLLYLHHYFLQLAVKQSSFERLIILYLAILALAGSGQRLGLDAQRAPAPRVVWAQRLIAAQSVFLYSGSGLWKLLGRTWRSGAVLESTFQGMWATPLAFRLTQAQLPAEAWTALTWSVVALELSLGPLLIWKRTRMLAVVLATLFHFGNWVLLFIPEFMLCVVALVVFIDDATLERALGWLAALTRFRRAGAA